MLAGLLHRTLTRDDVPALRVYGVMGVFRAVTPDRREQNRSEQKVWEQYLRFHERERARRAKLARTTR